MRILLVLPLVLALICGISLAATERGSDTTVNGWISDRNCGAKGVSASHLECLRQCLRSGDKLVVVTDTDQKLLLVENPEAVKGHEARHVAVSGRVDSATGTIHVAGVEDLKEH